VKRGVEYCVGGWKRNARGKGTFGPARQPFVCIDYWHSLFNRIRKPPIHYSLAVVKSLFAHYRSSAFIYFISLLALKIIL
jgi:hypothetical protein